MHPAPSVIVFTVLSGFGFGLMFWLGLGATYAHGWGAFWLCLLAGGTAVIGLLASTFHLGNPQRFLRALTQWRSSWLSREGIVSIAALTFFALYGAMWVFTGLRLSIMGGVVAGLAVVAVFCTAMIYAQLKTVPRWNTALTPLKFLLFSLGLPAIFVGLYPLALGYFLAVAVVQVLHWRAGDNGLAGRGHSPESATGLGGIGKVRLLEAPHSGPNYLMKEMVFRVGRARAKNLRLVTIGAGFVLPSLILLLFGLDGQMALPLVIIAVVSHAIGMTASRWLFFAEADHAVSLYYGHR